MSSVGISSPPLRTVVRTLLPPRGDKEKEEDDDEEAAPNFSVSRPSTAMMSHRIVKKILIVNSKFINIIIWTTLLTTAYILILKINDNMVYSLAVVIVIDGKINYDVSGYVHTSHTSYICIYNIYIFLLRKHHFLKYSNKLRAFQRYFPILVQGSSLESLLNRCY